MCRCNVEELFQESELCGGTLSKHARSSLHTCEVVAEMNLTFNKTRIVNSEHSPYPQHVITELITIHPGKSSII